jgi:hypothetical protein
METIRAGYGVRRTLLATDRLEGPGTAAIRGDTFHLGKSAVRGSMIVDEGVAGLVR